MFRDSKEKQSIREKLWLPIFRRYCKNIGIGNLKYLCFPGAHCFELKYFFAQGVLYAQNIVAVEYKEFEATMIQKYLNGKGVVFNGLLKELLDNNQKFISQFQNPFHIINLDCYGPANSLGFPAKPRNMELIRKIVELQKENRARKFCLLLTFNAKKEKVKGFDKIYTYIKNQKLTNIKILNKLLKKRNNHLVETVKKIILAAFSVGQIGFDNKYKVELIDAPRIYVGKNTISGKPYATEMIAVAVEFSLQSKDRSQFPIALEKALKATMNQAIILIQNTKYIVVKG